MAQVPASRPNPQGASGVTRLVRRAPASDTTQAGETHYQDHEGGQSEHEGYEERFQMRSTAATLAELERPIDPRHLRTRQQGSMQLVYCPWHLIARHLHHRAPGWCFEVLTVQEVAGSVVVTGRLTIPTTDGLLHYSAVASEPLESASQAPTAEVAASACLRRAAALAGLGLDLWS